MHIYGRAHYSMDGKSAQVEGGGLVGSLALCDADDIGFLAWSGTGADWEYISMPAGQIMLDNL